MKKILVYLVFYLLISFYFIIITYFGNYYSFLDYKLIWTSFFFLIIYIVLLFFINSKKIIYLISALMVIENVLNIGIIFNKFEVLNVTEYSSDKIEGIMKKYNNIGYRIEKSTHLSYNDSILMDYNGVSNFLSTTNYRILKFIYDYGFNEYDLEYSNLYMYLNQSYMLESFLGMKYVISNFEIKGYNLIEKVEISDDYYYVYQNPNSVGYGFMINNRCNDVDVSMLYSQDLFNCLFDSNYELFKEYKSKDGVYNIKSNYYYVFMNGISSTDFIDINSDIIDDVYYKSDNYYIFSKSKDNVRFNFDDSMDKESFKVMYFDYKLFSSIKYDSLNIENKDDNYLNGSIDVSEDGILMINLPYEAGFDVYVDGNKINYFEVANAFIGVNLKKGEHEIEIRYYQPKLKVGLLVGICSLLLCILYVYYDGRKLYGEKSI